MVLEITIHRKEENNLIRLSTSVTIALKDLELWFEIPLKYKGYLTKSADPFLLALLFPAMRSGYAIKITNGKISKTLLRNIYEVQRAWKAWKPERYSVIDIQADVYEGGPSREEKALCAFSGGIDGAFVLWQNLLENENPSPYPIQAMLYVEGFHIPLNKTEASQKIIQDLQKIADELRIKLITIRTNIRRFGDWHDYHGIALASCMTWFNGEFSVGLTGSSHPYEYLRFPWGSNAITDPLHSSSEFKLINAGAGFTRIQKIDKLRDWSNYLARVNVCTKEYTHNCGQCEKCLRTLLCFSVLNIPIPPTFIKTRLSAWQLLTLRAFEFQEVKDYTDILQTASRLRRKNGFLVWLRINILFNKTIRLSLYILGIDHLPWFRKTRKKIYQ